MRLVYVMDHVSRVSPTKDTTFAFLRASLARGHQSLHCEPRDVYLDGDEVFARVRELTVSDREPYFVFGEPHDVRLADVECVLIRKDPPFDSEYLYMTLMLERVRGRTVVINDPRGLRDGNEKLYALHFARHMPRTMVTSDRDRVHAFVAKIGTGVVKPLDGAGGAGVMVVEKGDRNTRSIVDTVTAEGTKYAMVQEFLPSVRAGDKRVLLLEGRVLGGINRIAREDDVRSNIHAGGRVEPCEVTAAERAVVADLAPRLAQDGLVFVGLDFIGGKLTEVNVTSPTGIQELSRHLGRDVATEVIEWVERKASAYRPPLGSISPS